MKNKDLKRRIIEISYKNNLSHLGSCLTAVDIIKEIYDIKKPDEKFVLSCAHSSLALYVVLEYYNKGNAEELFEKHGVHCNRDIEHDIWVSGGSLGHGIPISVGMALADRTKNIYVLCSDGELNEGSCYEALEVAEEQKLSNLKIYINCNGYGAFKSIDKDHLVDRCRAFQNLNISFRDTSGFEFEQIKDQKAHYQILNKDEYNQIIKTLDVDGRR